MSGARFTFICGSDDFVVGRLGRERFSVLAAAADEFSCEIISGFANNVAEVVAAVNRFRDAAQTLGLFGGRRYVWLKDVNFLADSVTGRAESTLAQVEELKAVLGALDPEQVGVLVTAAPLDRRRSFPKWVEANSDFTFVGGDPGDQATLQQLALGEAKELGVGFAGEALPVLLAKVGANSRLLVEEVRKLAAYVGGEGASIQEADVADIVVNTAEGDFFEAAEAFFSGSLQATLDALHRHFFAGGDARPVLISLQNRNRLLIQIKMLIDAGETRLGPGGLDKSGFARAQQTYGKAYGDLTEKSGCNIFTQNPWYLGKLASSAKMPSLKRMIDNQQEFYSAFQRLLQRPAEAEEVLREMAVRCLS